MTSAHSGFPSGALISPYPFLVSSCCSRYVGSVLDELCISVMHLMERGLWPGSKKIDLKQCLTLNNSCYNKVLKQSISTLPPEACQGGSLVCFSSP